MRFSTWSCEVVEVREGRTGLLRIALGVLACVMLVLAWPAPAVCEWRFIPEVRVAGGEESDLVIDPGLTRTVVPGGAFIEITPAVAARRSAGRDAIVDLGTFASLQRFHNDESRLLYAHTVWGDVFQSFGSSYRGRLSASFDYFDDSERESVRRVGLGGELGVAFVRPRWNIEMWGGVRGQRYPNIEVEDGQSQLSIYTETAWSGGATLRILPVERISFRGDGVLQTTESRDPSFDSVSWTVFGSFDARLVSSWFVTASGTVQERDFTGRVAGEDKDEYWQVGAGLRYTVSPGWTATIRWGYSDYKWPEGNSEDTYRLALGLHYVWGRRSAPPPPRVDIGALARYSGGSVQKPDPEGRVCLRVRAPGAGTVTVAGDFNGWSAVANRLRPAGDGWWGACIELAPGIYEYAYVIDGKWTTPPEAQLTVDDGFGGRNGILEVLPLGL